MLSRVWAQLLHNDGGKGKKQLFCLKGNQTTKPTVKRVDKSKKREEKLERKVSSLAVERVNRQTSSSGDGHKNKQIRHVVLTI